MCNTLRVRWTIIPQQSPQPWIACSGCGGPRAFQCSGKIRLNANGRKLDAWLIYKCASCEKTWNRPIFERRAVRGIDPAVLEALQSNDPHWIRAESFNLEALKRKSQRVDEFSAFEIGKELLHDPPNWTKLDIELRVPFAISMRLDRLLASELKISRSRLQALNDRGALQVGADRDGALRRRVRNGAHVLFDLTAETDREPSWKLAAIRHLS
ncbi:DUF1062 domain-containing protein [Rhizobium sp. PL01]|uniref:DUF1062 domain-containing protein n=1 Tax=Rhizobium sp. PL01 TaxID=3085631 RepID=UPI0029814B75|nr:DUF1062 domain-containing protein [Rhizobium sp. PL01]MDW5314037.1 DUF1062 domain-containing protein [Rhizobium sp. PL01]